MGGVGGGQDRLRQRAGAAADVGPRPARRNVQPGEELARDRAAPAADIAFIVRALPPIAPWETTLGLIGPRHPDLRVFHRSSAATSGVRPGTRPPRCGVISARRSADGALGSGFRPRVAISCGRSVNDWWSAPSTTSQRFGPVSSIQSRSQEVSRPPGACWGVPTNRNGRSRPRGGGRRSCRRG